MAFANQDVMQLLDTYLKDVGTGIAKQAEVDTPKDNTTGVQTGSRYDENSADIKTAIPNSVDAAEPGEANETPGGENLETNKIGVNKASTGKDVPTTKSTKDDPGTSHPARTDNVKYANANSTAGELSELANQILADISVATAGYQKQASAGAGAGQATAAKASKIPGVPDAAGGKPREDKAGSKNSATATAAVPTGAGHDEHLAGHNDTTPGIHTSQPKIAADQGNTQGYTDEQLGFLTAQFLTEQLVKTAQAEQQAASQTQMSDEQFNAIVESQMANIYTRADEQTTKLASFMQGYTKQAEGDPAAAAAGAPAGPDPMAGAMGGGGEAGGGDPAAALGANAPAGAAGGISPEILALAEALAQEGITPEQIHALAAQVGAGGGGGAPGGAPEGAAPGGAPAGVDPAAMGAAAGPGGPGGEKMASARNPKIVKLASALKDYAKNRGIK